MAIIDDFALFHTTSSLTPFMYSTWSSRIGSALFIIIK